MKNVNTNRTDSDNYLANKVSVYKFSPINDSMYRKYDISEDYYVASVDGELSLLDSLPLGVYKMTKLK